MAGTMVLVGTYTQPILFGTGEVLDAKGKGIYLYELQEGQLTLCAETAAVNASYLIPDRQGRYVYTTNELKEWQGQTGGSVSAYRTDFRENRLTYLNTVGVHGQDPCHLVLAPDGKTLFCANFMSGSVTALPVREDGSLMEDSCFIQHTGSGPDPNRQRGPHAHGVFLSPGGRWLYVPDLGADTIVCYAMDLTGHTLIPCPERNISIPDRGEGTRHMAFHPSGQWLYVNTEMGSSVYVYRFEEENGAAELLQKLSTIPADVDKAATSTAAIRIHPNGRILYVSNRGHDSLATYGIDEKSGMLTLLSIQSTGGHIPREFAISPDGEYLIAAHQSSDDLRCFRIQPTDGRLTFLSQVQVPNPICVQILEVP